LFINEGSRYKLILMVKITIENLAQKVLSVSDPTKSVLHVVQSNFVDWMHACGGKGRCTTCKMIVVVGGDHLSPPTKAELDYRKLGQLANTERLACQTRALGPCVIRVPEECKLPQVDYSG
jgi:ferredoxin, 2Fe-2S